MSRPAKGAATLLKESAPIFAALGDQTRLGIVARLCESGPTSITELTAGSGVSRQAVTKHLGVLAEAGLLQDTRAGREHIFELKLSRLEVARRSLDHISAQWDAALGRLKAFVES